ncbi:unnamed protein product [Rotaria magnacalcarata]|uniref:ABM domain-containing protein n=1 Tax=Rotaria magnacalcarata TaxID=392030 RepID=A0A816R5U8_9BILA|nr:unnamed protein product [Rotaria magnacalcarata]CAF1625217.1 unnamed protein product [Rotaria magnacalcarata]CAF2068194.1 unnamed protein product [Rotaria magnacalcarata]CAF2109395.1 unnamed protein product [Rotaria magnacalcarata]CAF2132634.1 unnamed protein product [Rotaria magnacalcarata]
MTESDIHYIVDIYIKLESVEKVRAMLLKIVQDSRNQDGCMEYELFENLNDQSNFMFIETWGNEAAFENHSQSDHIQQASLDINSYLAKATDIKRYKYLKIPSKQLNTRNKSRFCTLF